MVLRYFFLALIGVVFALPLGACCTGRCVPVNYVCREPTPPTDPLADSTVNDGLTPEERTAFVRGIVGSTVFISVDRYTGEDGTTGHNGTGVVIDGAGTILTAYHVVRDSVFVTVTVRTLAEDGLTVTDGRRIPVVVSAVAPERDAALLTPLYGESLPVALPVDRNLPHETVLLWQFGARSRWARGYVTNPGTASSGIADVAEMQAPAAVGADGNPGERPVVVRHGDSGGPVVSAAGVVVGIVLSLGDEGRKMYFIPAGLALDSLGYAPPPAR